MRIAACLLLVSFLLFGCVSETQGPLMSQDAPAAPSQGNPVKSSDNITVEVYHFHGTSQCYSCIRVGELAEKTVNTYFKGELESGQLVFGHINGELPENRGLANEYGVTGASLWIGTRVNGQFHKEQNINVWYKTGDEAGYMAYLKGILEKRLAGELN